MNIFVHSSVAVFILSGLATPAAAALAVESKSFPPHEYSKNTKVAGFGDFLRRTNEVLDTIERQQRREEQRRAREAREIERQERAKAQEQERQRRLAEAQKRREEYEARKAAATERERQEAERRCAYLDGLSPQERESFLAEQRAKQEEADAAAALLLLQLFAVGAEMSASGSSSGDVPPECIGIDLNGTRESCMTQKRMELRR